MESISKPSFSSHIHGGKAQLSLCNSTPGAKARLILVLYEQKVLCWLCAAWRLHIESKLLHGAIVLIEEQMVLRVLWEGCGWESDQGWPRSLILWWPLCRTIGKCGWAILGSKLGQKSISRKRVLDSSGRYRLSSFQVRFSDLSQRLKNVPPAKADCQSIAQNVWSRLDRFYYI